MKSEFMIAITQLAAEKNLPKEVVLQAMEAALVSAYKKDSDIDGNVAVRIDRETGEHQVFIEHAVVQEVTDPTTEISVQDARKRKPDAMLGDVLLDEVHPGAAGRIAAQTAKQVVLQRLREAEREMVFEEFSSREGDIVSGVIQRVEPKQLVVDLGKTEALLPAAEQVRTENYRPGARMKFYLLEVHRSMRGPQLILSRTHKNLLKRLFELEVPEIYRGVVEIKSIAREAGYRSKVAVTARQEGVDPVGSCVGLRGIRIQNIVNELNGERIDVIQWDAEPSRFVGNALSPAQVLTVRMSDEDNTASVIVPDRQLSLAIGKEGQNARLAAKLTGWRIDIKPESAMQEAVAAAGATATATRTAAPRPAPEPSTPVRREEPSQPWMEVVEETAAPPAEEQREPEPAVVGAPEPAPEPGGPRIRFAEDLAPVLAQPKKKKAKKVEKASEAEGKPAKKGAKRARRPVDDDEDIDVPLDTWDKDSEDA
ncbi:MAG: transcription termination/antitermination protein NusA [Chloroflexi bacterium]|nr:MAG: transcription termination/antitermination protein NusA [Chloroflexota bacterium]